MPKTRAIQKRSIERRKRIIAESMAYFAQYGFDGTRMDSLARALRVSKGSIFQHFGSKEGLFLAVYREAVGMLGTYFDAPAEVLRAGFFEVVGYWLTTSEKLIREDMRPYRVVLVGNYGVGMVLRLEINRFLRTEDPYRTLDFVRTGIERGEVRDDIDAWLIASTLDWFIERFQDVFVTEELDQGLFRNVGETGDRHDRIGQFVELIRGAIGSRAAP